jgi:hypothetical protein
MSNVSGSVTIVESTSPTPGKPSSAFDADLVVFPDHFEGDRGVYSDQLVSTVKTLRADGIDARWYHDADHRLWSGERSALVTLVIIPFIVGIGSPAGWAGLAHLLSRRGNGQVKLKIGYSKGPLHEERWLELEGTSADVATALEKINPWQLPGASLDGGATGADPSDALVFGKMPSIDSLAKMAAAFIIACYAIGFLVVNTYLLRYNISDFNLFRGRFIFTGLLLIAFLLLAVICPLFAISAIVSGWKRRLPLDVPRPLAIFMALAFLIVPIAAFRGLAGIPLKQALVEYFLNAALGGLLILGYLRIRDYSRKKLPGLRKSFAIALGGLLLAGLMTYAVLVLNYFATTIYPSTPEEWGGSRGQYVQLLINHDSVDGVRQLGIPILADSDTTYRSLLLLFKGEDFYLVQYGGKTYVLMADVVKGMRKS